MGRIAPVWSRVSGLTVSHGEGSWVYTVDGERYLDFTSGIAVTSTGHAHPAVVAAIEQQARRFVHAQVNCYQHDLLQPLCDALDAITPQGIDTFFLANSGAEATEAAVKLSKQHTRRPVVGVFDGSFHGRTHQAMAMTASKSLYRFGYGILPGGVVVLPFATSNDDDAAVAAAVTGLERVMHTQVSPEEVACLLVEPVQGEGGYRAVHPSYLAHLRRWCDDAGALLVADEVQTGFGRTGTMFAIEQYGVDCDIIVMAKGIASGFPMSAIGASWDLMGSWVPGSHGGTYGGNPVGCAAALATIDLLRNGLLANAAARGRQMRDGLQGLFERFESVVEVHGIGLMSGLSLAEPSMAARVRERVQARRVLMMTAGHAAIRLMPPLVVTAEELDLALGALGAAIAEVEQGE